MAITIFLLFGLGCLMTCTARVVQDDVRPDWSVRAPELRRSLEQIKCKKVGDQCWGVPTCCGSAQCYWEEGYNIYDFGVCVNCVDQDQKCQRDAQCCDPLVCQKRRAARINGLCQPRRANGQPCHEDDQCASGHCNQKWWQISDGVCKDE